MGGARLLSPPLSHTPHHGARSENGLADEGMALVLNGAAVSDSELPRGREEGSNKAGGQGTRKPRTLLTCGYGCPTGASGASDWPRAESETQLACLEAQTYHVRVVTCC